jgi:hypothetical protein
MAKGLAKICSWGGYLPLSIQKPKGIEHAQAIATKTMAMPPSILSKPSVSLICLCLIALGTFFGLRENRLAGGRKNHIISIVILAVAAVELYLVWGWRY